MKIGAPVRGLNKMVLKYCPITFCHKGLSIYKRDVDVASTTLLELEPAILLKLGQVFPEFFKVFGICTFPDLVCLTGS